MLIFNHVSYVDGIILGAYFLPCGLAKASIADIPFFGTFCRVCPHTSTPLFLLEMWVAARRTGPLSLAVDT